MVKQASLASDLESMLGASCLLPPAEFPVDGVTPQAAVAPASYDQVAEVMRYAHTNDLAVIPWGGGTHMHIGNVPRRYDIALSLSRLDQVVEHEPADLTVTCQAGITLGALQGHLARAGQSVPLSVRTADVTMGGILASNAAGPARHAYGSPRDFTIGMRVVTADGRITKAGGRVVKNVAGYDLCKLYIGSLGTLGVIVEATLKVVPLPKAEGGLALKFDSPAAACALDGEAHRRGLSLRAVELLSPAAAAMTGLRDEAWLLLFDLAGAPAAVKRSRREIEEIAAGLSAPAAGDAGELSRAARSAMAWTSLLVRASVLPSQLPSFTDALEALDPPPIIVAWPTLGVTYASWQDADNAEVLIARSREAVSRLGGTLLVAVCPLELKHRIDIFPDLSPPTFDLMRRVKQQFDPSGVLSPGRFLGRL